MFENIFFRKKVLIEKLVSYGFKKQEAKYVFETDIMNGNFHLIVSVSQLGNVNTSIIDVEANEEYALYKTNATGVFVCNVRHAIEIVLNEIADKCYEPAIFKSAQSLKLISYVQATYGDALEFLWTKFPNNAIWRRKDNEKWYGVLLTLSKTKLDGKSGEIVEIVDLRERPTVIENLIDREKYYPGWHMNKKNWYTIVLDNSVPDYDLFKHLDMSYNLAKQRT